MKKKKKDVKKTGKIGLFGKGQRKLKLMSECA
jgi:hypothetical protein